MGASVTASDHIDVPARVGGRVVAAWSRWATVGDDKRDDLRDAGMAVLSLAATGVIASGRSVTSSGHQIYPGPYATVQGCGAVWVDGVAGAIKRAAV